MKTTLATLLLCIVTTFLYGQSSCGNILFLDKAVTINTDLPLQKLKHLESVSFIPDSTKKRIKNETIQVTSGTFFQKLQVKKVLIFDSAVREKIFNYSSVYDATGNEVDFLYVFFYELKLNGTIPFILRVDYKRNGGLLNKEQLINISSKTYTIISCNKAMVNALSDKVEPIKKVESIFLYFHPALKTIVYQITEPLNNETHRQRIKYVSAYSGKVVLRDEIELMTGLLEETSIGE